MQKPILLTQLFFNGSLQTRCLRGSDVTTKVLITENTDLIEGLAYNWMSQQLFWVDSGHKRIEVARKDGTNRKVLINTTLDQPRAIVLYPKFGFVICLTIQIQHFLDVLFRILCCCYLARNSLAVLFDIIIVILFLVLVYLS